MKGNSFTFFVRECLMRGIGATEALAIWLDRHFTLPPIAQETPHRYLTAFYSSTPPSGPTGDGLLLESGDFLLAESADYLITEA